MKNGQKLDLWLSYNLPSLKKLRSSFELNDQQIIDELQIEIEEAITVFEF